jgi:hypothetical protein
MLVRGDCAIAGGRSERHVLAKPLDYFYTWKKRYGGLTPSEVKRMGQLEDENNRLKNILADLTLERRCCRMSSARKL